MKKRSIVGAMVEHQFLNNLQKIKDGERLSGRASARSDFKGFETDVFDDEDILF